MRFRFGYRKLTDMPPKKTLSGPVLLVEDEAMLATMYQTKFTMENVPIEVASNGEDGLVKAKAIKPSLILLDIILPKLDGFAVLKELKADSITKDIPVILLTNLGQDDDVRKGQELGAVDYFVKSNHTPADIVTKAKEFLNGKK